MASEALQVVLDLQLALAKSNELPVSSLFFRKLCRGRTIFSHALVACINGTEQGLQSRRRMHVSVAPSVSALSVCCAYIGMTSSRKIM